VSENSEGVVNDAARLFAAASSWMESVLRGALQAGSAISLSVLFPLVYLLRT
jgi:hypothetical protein